MILFLDFDGIIVHSHCPNARTIDKSCLSLIKELCDKYDAKIVVSSAWRIGRTTEELDQLLHENGLIKGTVIGKTITKMTGLRGIQIVDWIEENKYTGDYVVIDDENFDLGNIPKEKIIYVKDGWITMGIHQNHIAEWEKNRYN